MKMVEIKDYADFTGKDIIWITSKQSLNQIVGKNNVDVALGLVTVETQGYLLNYLYKIDTLYINPSHIKHDALKSLIIEYSPELFL